MKLHAIPHYCVFSLVGILNLNALYMKFVEETGDALRRVQSHKPTMLLGDFDVDVGRSWSVIGQHGVVLS